MPIKITYVISKIDRPALEFLWVAERLDKVYYALQFILLNKPNTDLEKSLKAITKVKTIPYYSKRNFISVFWRICRLLFKSKPDIVHTHMLDANLIGLLAAKLAGVKHRVYTRHHSSLNYDYYSSKVIYDKVANFLSTSIVSISPAVTNILIEWEKVKRDKITEIPHGLELRGFMAPDPRTIECLRAAYNPKNSAPVIGVISRYTHWKGIQHIIPAFNKLLEDYPQALLLLANARQGEYVKNIDELLADIPSKNYLEISFEPEVASLYQLFDVFVHVPVNQHAEAFGQIYIESLATGVPCIFTLSGIAPNIPEINENAEIVPFEDSDAIHSALMRILSVDNIEGKKGKRQNSISHFTIKQKIEKLEMMYTKLINV